MIRIFLGNNFSSVFLLPFFVAVYILLNEGYFGVDATYFGLSGSVDLGLWGGYTEGNQLWLKFIPGACILLNALTLNFLFNIHNFHDRNTYFVSLLYIILMSFYHSFYQLDGVIIAHLFLILSLFQLFRLESNVDGRKIAFNAAFLFGIAASFHPPVIFTFLLLWIMILRIRPFVLREFLLAVTGFLIPVMYGFLFVLWNKEEINWNFLETSVNYTQKEIIFLSSMLLFIVSGLLSAVGIRIKLKKSSIRFRNLTSIIFIIIILGLALGIVEILFLRQYEWFSFGMIGLALLLPFSFLNKSTSMFATVLFYMTFLFSIAKFYIK